MTARNVFNTEAVDGFVESLGEVAEHEAVRLWLDRAARRHVLRYHDRFYRVVRERGTDRVMLADPEDAGGFDLRPLDGPVPEWCGRALDEGREVIFLRLDGPLSRTMRRIIAYLDDVLARKPDRNLDRIGFAQARQAAAQWHRAQRRKRRPRWQAEPGAIPVFRLGRNATVVQLTTPESLEREGRRMNHCVAIYADNLRLGECEIYSLRDAAGVSRATIEVDPEGCVVQVKGRENRPVAATFRPAVKGFIRARGYIQLYDHWNVSFLADALAASDFDFESFFTSREGLGLARAYRFGGGEPEPDVERLMLARRLHDYSFSLPEAGLRALFRALSPGRGAPVMLREGAGYHVYDLYVPIIRVDVPLILLNLVHEGIFDRLRPERDEGRRILRAVEGILPTLVFREIDRVYMLGPTRGKIKAHRELPWDSTADFLIDCPYDIRSQRANRHRAMLERVNAAKRRVAGRRPPASPEQLALRRLVTGAAGVYAI